MTTRRPRLVALALAAMATFLGSAEAATKAACPGTLPVNGLGDVSLVPTGWGVDEEVAQVGLQHGVIEPRLGSRAYFASNCTAGVYNNSEYLALDLRGRTLTYASDLSKAGCGCNAALYLVSMRQNERPSQCGDYYCDANNVCGESCAEIDIQEGNRFAFQSTLHGAKDHFGLGKGYSGGGTNWNGAREWTAEEFGPSGRCIDTDMPFAVSVYFPVDDVSGMLKAVEVTLSQAACHLWLSVGGYAAMAELDAALAAGMTPVVSYWSSHDMRWLDGKGLDDKGPCEQDSPATCGDTVRFYNFSVAPAFPPTTLAPSTEPKPPNREALPDREVLPGREVSPGREMPPGREVPPGREASKVTPGSWCLCPKCDERAFGKGFVTGAFTMIAPQLCVLAYLSWPRGQQAHSSPRKKGHRSAQSLLMVDAEGSGRCVMPVGTGGSPSRSISSGR